MKLDNLINSFKYSSLLTNRDLKLFKQNFDKHKPNIELYSVWNFQTDIEFMSDLNNKLMSGNYILLGIIKNNDLIFLEYIDQLDNVAPYDAYINQISVKEFIKFKLKQIIQPVQNKNEELIFKYIYSYFNQNPFEIDYLKY